MSKMIAWIKRNKAWSILVYLLFVSTAAYAVTISSLTALTGSGSATGDLFVVVDISEAAAADRTKNITRDELAIAMAAGFATDAITGNDVIAGTDSARGSLELSTDAEAVTGTDTARAVTAANLTARMAAPGTIGNTTAAAGNFTTLGLAGDLTFSNDEPEILGNDTDGRFHVSSGTSNALGANIILHGDTQTDAGDFYLRDDITDVIGYDASANTLTLTEGTILVSGNSQFTGGAANGELMNIQSATTTGTLSSGATITLTNLIPAGSLVMGVVARVTTEITGPTSWLLGVSGDTNQWGDILALPAGTTVDYADITGTSPPEFFAAATSVLITRGSASDFTAGVVRVTILFVNVTAPTG